MVDGFLKGIAYQKLKCEQLVWLGEEVEILEDEVLRPCHTLLRIGIRGMYKDFNPKEAHTNKETI